MFEWLKRRQERHCIEQAEEIVGTRRELDSAQRAYDRKSKSFWSAPTGLVIRGQWPLEVDRCEPIYVNDIEVVRAIEALVLASERNGIKRLSAKLDALVGGR